MEKDNVKETSCRESDFGESMDRVCSTDLSVADEVMLTYEPGRKVTFRYLGDSWFEVVSRENNQLLVGDRLLIEEFEKHHAYLAKKVIRGDENLGNYSAAVLYGGIRTLFVKRAE